MADKESPMQKRQRQPGPHPVHSKHEKYDNKRHEFSFIQGMKTWDNIPIFDDDYYGYLGGVLGFYNAEKYPFFGPLTHDTNTTTALHFYDTSKQKTPIDIRLDVINPNLSQVAQDYTNADLYDVQDFAEASSKRIKEKTHRILNDPERKFQSQKLIDIQNLKGHLHKRKHIPSIEKLVAYNSMLLDVNTLLLNRMTDILDYQEKSFMFNKYETKPLSQNFYAEMTLTDGAEATKLDFTDDSNNRNIPSNAVIRDFPKHNLLSLQIIFDSGTNLYFATNKPTNSLETTVKLTSPPVPFNIAPGQFSIKSVNIRASGADGVVRLIGLY